MMDGLISTTSLTNKTLHNPSFQLGFFFNPRSQAPAWEHILQLDPESASYHQVRE